jgi:hypothetical protein
MADHATLAVNAAARVDGITLDYGVLSLVEVDRVLGQFHNEGPAVDKIAETIFSFGAYVGEVMVRSAGGVWVTVTDDHPLAGGWPLVQLPDSGLSNPLGKAFKRVENGAGDSIPYFYDVFARG